MQLSFTLQRYVIDSSLYTFRLEKFSVTSNFSSSEINKKFIFSMMSREKTRSQLWPPFDTFSSFFFVLCKIISIFANAFCLIWLWCPLSRTEPLGGALHIRRRYWRFVFVLRNYHTRILDKNIADVIPRGVYIRLRSVLRGLSPLAHFTDIYIPCVGVYSDCFLARLW